MSNPSKNNPRIRLSKRRGMTMIETMISTAIMSILFSSSAGAIAIGSRYVYALHRQSINQSQCSASMERIANVMRNAMEFAPCEGAATDGTPQPCIRFYLPTGTDVYNRRQGTLKFTPAPIAIRNDRDPATLIGDLKLTWSNEEVSSEVPSAWSSADMALKGVINFSAELQSSQHTKISMSFYQPSVQNRGLGRLPDNTFTTDITAKNHILLEGLNDAEITAALHF